MAVVTPPEVTSAPTPAPQRGDRATFRDRVDGFITWMIAAVAQFAALAQNVYSNALEAFSYAQASQAQAEAAQALVNVAKWVSGTTYQNGAVVWAPANGQTYRRITAAGSGTTDPSVDSVNWSAVVGMLIQSFAPGTSYTVPKTAKGLMLRFGANSTVTFPSLATLGEGWYCFIQNNGTGEVVINPAAGETLQGYTAYSLHKDGCAIVSVTGAQLSIMPFAPRSSGVFGSTIAASATLNLDSSEGDVLYVSGSVDITNVTLAAGVQKTVIFLNTPRILATGNVVLPDGLPLALNNGSAMTFAGKPGGLAHIVGLGFRNTGFIHLQDQKPPGTAAQALASGTETARTLGVTVASTIQGVTVGATQLTLPAGSYKIHAFAPAAATNAHRARLYNVTDSAAAVVGKNAYAPNGTNTVTDAVVQGYFTIAAAKVFELRHWASGASNGGSPANQSGVVEVYTDIYIEKIA